MRWILYSIFFGSVLLHGEKPPYWGTAHIMPEFITESDPSDFIKLDGRNIQDRIMYDRRTGTFSETKAYVFVAFYLKRREIEIQVNAEFEESEAKYFAEFYGRAVGQLPISLTDSVKTMWIHKGRYPFGGGNDNILIHVDLGKELLEAGNLEEVLIHEAVHSSLDPKYKERSQWRKAQELDGRYISQYAMDHPIREDMAESFLPYLAIRYRKDRISLEMYETIESTMKNRIEYFDTLQLDPWPLAVED